MCETLEEFIREKVGAYIYEEEYAPTTVDDIIDEGKELFPEISPEQLSYEIHRIYAELTR